MDKVIEISIAVILALFMYAVTTGLANADTDTWDIRDGDWYAEVGAGYSTSLFQSNPDYQWESGGSPGFYGAIRYEWMPIQDRLGVVFHYAHMSNWFTGPPFNHDAESSLDHFGMAVRWRLGK